MATSAKYCCRFREERADAFLAEEPVRVCLCALLVFDEKGDMRSSSRNISKGKQPRGKLIAHILIGGVLLEDCVCWRNCSVFACA